MVAGNKDKKLKVAERGEEDNNQIDEELVLSIEKLQEIQDDLEFLSHPALGTLLSEEDQKIFKFLSSLQVEDSKDVNSGYSITSYFEPNPYFEETKLIKSFAFHDEGTTEIAATPISWKEGMGLQNGVSHENKGKKRLLADESFLSWFISTQPKGMIDDMQDEVAEIIKEDLWPNPLSYFNTDPYIEDFGEDEADEGEKDGDDSEEEDEKEEDDDEEDDDTGK